MKVGTFRALCAAAVAGALAVPAMAQNVGTPTAEGATRQAPNGARGAEGEAGTVRPNTGLQAGQVNRGGTPVRPTARPAGTIVEDQRDLPSGTRTANFPPQGRAAGARGQLGDAALVRWVSADNESEIRVSEVAQQKAQNQQVKQFAQMMVDEHTKLGQKLRQASAQRGQGGLNDNSGIEERSTNRRNARDDENGAEGARRSPNSRSNDNANDDNNVAFQQEEERNNSALQGRLRNANRNADSQNDAAASGAAAGGMRRGGDAGVALHEQIKEACTQSVIQDLQSRQGAEFDKAYIGGQIMAHMGMLDTLKIVSQQASSPELKQTLQQAQQSTQQHLQKAKDLMKQLENERQ